MVVFDCLFQFEGRQIVQIELTALERNLLLHSWVHTYLLDVVVSVWCVKHLRGIVDVSLLSDTGIHADVCLALGIDFELELQLVGAGDFLKHHKSDYPASKNGANAVSAYLPS